MVILAPSWLTIRRGLSTRISPLKACELIGSWLHSDTRLGKLYRRLHFSAGRFRRHFVHHGADTTDLNRLTAIAAWMLQRPRPYVQTDAAAMCGFMDPHGSPTASELSETVLSTAQRLKHGA